MQMLGTYIKCVNTKLLDVSFLLTREIFRSILSTA